jgi:hypothetical protein
MSEGRAGKAEVKMENVKVKNEDAAVLMLLAFYILLFCFLTFLPHPVLNRYSQIRGQWLPRIIVSRHFPWRIDLKH